MAVDDFQDEGSDDEEDGRKRRRRRRKRRTGEGGGRKRKSRNDRYKKYYRRARDTRLAKSVYKITNREDMTTKRCLMYLIPIACIVGGAIGIIVATGNGDKIAADKFRGIVPILDPTETEDPFAGTSTVPKWKADGRGLTLELSNALQDAWQLSLIHI